MFTLISPTMWLNPNFIQFLYDLTSHPLVGQIIIIDNDKVVRPSNSILHHHKIEIISFDENIFVNSSWNWGVRNSAYDKICILNDNSIFDLKVFDRVHPHLTEDVGVMGINWNNEVINDGMIRIKKYQGGDLINNFFRLFFVHKKTYSYIPNGLKLYFGDDFCFNSCIIDNKNIFIINDLFFYTENGGTTRYIPEAKEMFLKEKEEYRRILINQGIDPKVFCPHHY